MNGNTDGHGIADYPTCAWLRLTETVSVLPETFQSRTDAPLQQLGRIQPPVRPFAKQQV